MLTILVKSSFRNTAVWNFKGILNKIILIIHTVKLYIHIYIFPHKTESWFLCAEIIRFCFGIVRKQPVKLPRLDSLLLRELPFHEFMYFWGGLSSNKFTLAVKIFLRYSESYVIKLSIIKAWTFYVCFGSVIKGALWAKDIYNIL